MLISIFINRDLTASYERALAHGKYDPVGGGHYYWDPQENLWWRCVPTLTPRAEFTDSPFASNSWDTPYAITQKFPRIMEKKKVSGNMSYPVVEPLTLNHSTARRHVRLGLRRGRRQVRAFRRVDGVREEVWGWGKR